MGYDFDFSVIWQYRSLFLQGALMTIRITGVATALGLLVGILMAGLQLIRFRPLSMLIQAYIEVIRNTPFLVQLFFFYFGLPTVNIFLPAWQAAIIALTINIGAYATEIVRAGIESISTGQIEAGRSLGLSGLQVFQFYKTAAVDEETVIRCGGDGVAFARLKIKDGCVFAGFPGR